jgi:hypothetical protein
MNMRQTRNGAPRIGQLALGSLLAVGLLIAGSTLGFSREKYETIEASAEGTGTQVGQMVNVTLNIYDYSTEDDRQTLLQAFQKGQDQGLVNALTKMKAVGHMELTGFLGYDCSFIRSIPTPTGRQIRFVTNRTIRFGEAFSDAQSMSYDLSGGEIDLNDTDKKKSTGVLYPRARIVLDKEGQLKIELTQNPWKLVNILDRK